jgi:hypothetical protein
MSFENVIELKGQFDCHCEYHMIKECKLLILI